MNNIKNRILYINNRLTVLRMEYLAASDAKRLFIKTGAELLKTELKTLENKLAIEEGQLGI